MRPTRELARPTTPSRAPSAALSHTLSATRTTRARPRQVFHRALKTPGETPSQGRAYQWVGEARRRSHHTEHEEVKRRGDHQAHGGGGAVRGREHPRLE